MYRLASVALCCGVVLQAQQGLLEHAIGAHQKGDVDTAVAEYRAYLKQNPKAVAVRSNLGAALSSRGEYEAAIVEYRQALAGEENPAVRLNLSLAYYKAADFGAAAESLVKVHAAQPANRQATLLLADCYLRQGRDAQAVALVEPMAGPDDQAAAYILGTAYLQMNQVNKGQEWIERIMKGGDSGQARLLLGTAKMRANDFAGAREDFAKAVELAPQLPNMHSAYGMSLVNTGDVAGAAEHFRLELKGNPNDYLANVQLGALLRQEQDYAGARKNFDRALLVRPRDAAARYQLALVDVSEGRVEESAKELESLVAEAPQFTEAHVTLATVYYRLKRKQDGDRERATVQRLNSDAQAKQPGVKQETAPK